MARVERNAVWVIGLLVLLVLGVTVWTVFSNWRSNTRVYVGDVVIDAKIVRTPEDRERGLGGTTKLKPKQGMLFVFAEDKPWSIWMKDMLVPIDAIWLNKDKKVVHIIKNISPDSFPETFEPKTDARYILEVPAGTAEANKVIIGKQASFELPTY